MQDRPYFDADDRPCWPIAAINSHQDYRGGVPRTFVELGCVGAGDDNSTTKAPETAHNLRPGPLSP